MTKLDQILTAKQAAKRLGVSHAQLTRYAKSGLLPATRHGQMLVIREADLADFRRPPRGPKASLKKSG